MFNMEDKRDSGFTLIFIEIRSKREITWQQHYNSYTRCSFCDHSNVLIVEYQHENPKEGKIIEAIIHKKNKKMHKFLCGTLN